MANQTEAIKKKLIEQRVKAPKLSPVAQKGAQMDTLKQAVMPKGWKPTPGATKGVMPNPNVLTMPKNADPNMMYAMGGAGSAPTMPKNADPNMLYAMGGQGATQAVMPKGYNSKDVLAKRHYTGGKIDPDKMFGGRGLQAIGQGAMPEDEWHDVDLGNSESQNMDGMTSDVMPANGANSDPRLQAMQDLLQGGADAQKKSQEAQLAQARDKQIAELKKALDDAVAEGEISVRESEKQFNEQKQEIEQQAFDQSGAMKLGAQSRGIQNSQQMNAMQSDADMRKNSIISKTMTERDLRVNNVRDRINSIKNKSAIDIAGANSAYDQGVTSVNSGIDAQMFDNMFKMQQEQFQAERDQGYDLDKIDKGHQNDLDKMDKGQGFDLDKMSKQNEYDLGKISVEQKNTLINMAKAHGYDLDKMSVEQKNTLINMAKQNGYDMAKMTQEQKNTLINMGQAYKYDMSKMSQQQKNVLAQMAKAQGYDLSKMSKQQQYDLAKMAQGYGYDMGLQNDSQDFQGGMQDDAQRHDSGMQEDSQAHQDYMAGEERKFQDTMFGKEQSAKLAEYDTALKREMASYDASTPEGKLRIKQLESSRDAMLTESMTGTIGELMGQSFVTKYGEGMTTEQMQQWLKDPTNLKNLEMKVKKADLPKEKKGFLSEFITGMAKGSAPGRIFTAYRDAFRNGLPDFFP
jgi:hypothetical protein